MSINLINKRTPMASAPMKYLPDGSVDWANMWDSFCVLAQEGGPPHRGMMLDAPGSPDLASEGYWFAVNEIIRGIKAVSGLTAAAAEPGWIAVYCSTGAMARWLAEAIIQENVQARHNESILLVPVGDNFALKDEIKNVITVVAKTTHYWREHLPSEVKDALALQERLEWLKQRVKGWWFVSNPAEQRG